MSFSTVLAFHISAGTLGLLSGAAAMSVRKGSRRHRVIGNVFVLSMLGLATSAVYLAMAKHEMPNVLGAIFTSYMVGTASLTARRRNAGSDIRGWIGLVVVLALLAVYFSYGLEAARSPTGTKDGYPAPLYFFSALLALMSAAGDLRVLAGSGISSTQRLARHIWRMCYGLFVASGSIFLARPRLFPVLLRKTGILVLLGVLPLILMIFWLIRVRFRNAIKEQSAPDGSGVEGPRPRSRSLTNKSRQEVSV